MRRMPLMSFVLAAALLAVSAGRAGAHSWQGPVKSSVFTLEKLTDQIYVLYGIGGNVAFMVADDGVLVIDDQYQTRQVDGQTVEIAQGIVDQIHKVTDKPIRFLINTHYHGDHTGGNPIFVRTTAIIAHRNTRKNLLTNRAYILQTTPQLIAQLQNDLERIGGDAARAKPLQQQLDAAQAQLAEATSVDIRSTLPHITYDNEIQVYLGDEEIRVFHLGAAHTSGDSVVLFSNNRVVHWGDVFVNKSHAFIDRRGGADSKAWIDFLENGLKMVPPDAKMIPGHGKVGTADDVRAFRQYFIDLRAGVAEAIKRGQTHDQVVTGLAFPQFKDYAGGDARLRANIGTIYDEMKGTPVLGGR